MFSRFFGPERIHHRYRKVKWNEEIGFKIKEKDWE